MRLYNYLPSLDLHGMDREYAVFKTKEFIHDQYKMKKEQISIIHGIGTGVLRKAIHEYLKTEYYVESYKINNFNAGETLVLLKKNN